MLGMYPSKNANISIFFGAVHVFAGLLYLLRNQSTVDDVDYIEAMIPHHSIAILTSERAQITDPRVRKLDARKNPAGLHRRLPRPRTYQNRFGNRLESNEASSPIPISLRRFLRVSSWLTRSSRRNGSKSPR